MTRALTQRQAELLSRLETLFLNEGFGHLTLDDIASRLHCSKSQTPGGPSMTVLTVNVAAPATGASPSATPTTTVADASFVRIPCKQPTPPTGPRRMWTPGSNELFGFVVNAVRIGTWSSRRGGWPIRRAPRRS